MGSCTKDEEILAPPQANTNSNVEFVISSTKCLEVFTKAVDEYAPGNALLSIQEEYYYNPQKAYTTMLAKFEPI